MCQGIAKLFDRKTNNRAVAIFCKVMPKNFDKDKFNPKLLGLTQPQVAELSETSKGMLSIFLAKLLWIFWIYKKKGLGTHPYWRSSIGTGWCNNWVASTRIAGQIEM